MKKIIYFLFISSLCFSQPLEIKSIVLKSDLYKVLESKLGVIESVNGKTWICYPDTDLVIDSKNIVTINGFPVIYSGNGKSLKLPDKKIDLIQLNFKDKKKTIIKGGSYKDCLGYPTDAKKKVEEELKKMKKKEKDDTEITTSPSL